MELPDLNDLSFPDSDADPVVLTAFDGVADIKFAPDKDDPTGLGIAFTYRFPHDAGELRAEVEAYPEEIEALYRLVRATLARTAREIVADKLADPELPPLKVLRAIDVPAIVLKPLVLEDTGRRRVLDVRAGSVVSYRREHLDTYSASDERGEWGYVTGVKVHRVTCASPKVRKIRTDLELATSWTWEVRKKGLDGRPAWFEEILPQVAVGNLHVEMCLTCKPLGEYSKWINERIPSGVLSDADRKLIAPHLSAQDVDHRSFLWFWRQWVAMTPQRWEALAELIGFLDYEVNGERGPAAGENDGDTVG